MRIGRYPLWPVFAGVAAASLAAEHGGLTQASPPVAQARWTAQSSTRAPVPAAIRRATTGPFRLAETINVEGFDHDLAAMAPNLGALVFPDRRTRTLAIVDLRTTVRATAPYPGDVSAFSPIRSAEPLAAWARNGTFLWSATRALTSPSGFATSGLSPVRVARDGTVTLLPPLRSSAGRLDALQ